MSVPQGFGKGDTIDLEMGDRTLRVHLKTAESAAYANGMASAEIWRERTQRVPADENRALQTG